MTKVIVLETPTNDNNDVCDLCNCKLYNAKDCI